MDDDDRIDAVVTRWQNLTPASPRAHADADAFARARMRADVRVVAHLDLDAFYCQVERAAHGIDANVPLVVAQYDPFERGGVRTHDQGARRILRDGLERHSLIAVSYEARARGVKRNMRAIDARRLCGDGAVVVQVPTRRSKADLTAYRRAGAAVARILSRGGVMERASIDEAYLDLTANARRTLAETEWREVLATARKAHVAGAAPIGGKGFVSKASLRAGSADGPQAAVEACAASTSGVTEEKTEKETEKETEAEPVDEEEERMRNYRPRPPDEASLAWWDREESAWGETEKLLAAGAYICHNLRKACVDELGYTLSAGIATNKMLAKLTSGMNKPASQTVLCPDHTEALLAELPIDRIRGLGAKFGRELVEGLDVKTIGELARTPIRKLEEICGEERAQWVRKVSLGQDDDPVKEREMPKSIGTGKTFRGALAIRSLESAKKWLAELAAELNDRCEDDRDEWNREPKLLTLGLSSPDELNTNSGHCSRRCPMRLGADEITQDALALISKWSSGRSNWSITGMSVSASNFVTLERESGDIAEMLKNAKSTTGSRLATPAASPIKADQIDASVLAELPEEIQREIRASMRGETSHRGNRAAAGSALLGKRKGGVGAGQKNSITSYFGKTT